MRGQDVTRDRRKEEGGHLRSRNEGGLLRKAGLFSSYKVVHVQRGGSAGVLFASLEFVNDRGAG